MAKKIDKFDARDMISKLDEIRDIADDYGNKKLDAAIDKLEDLILELKK